MSKGEGAQPPEPEQQPSEPQRPSDTTAGTVEQTLDWIREAHRQKVMALQNASLDQHRLINELSSTHVGVSMLADILGQMVKVISHTPAPDPQYMRQRRFELVKLRAEHLYEESRGSERALIEFAQIGLRSLLLANGGALVAMLTFVGNFHDETGALDSLRLAALSYVLGLFASLVAVLLAYFSQGKASLQQDAGAEKIWFLEYEGDGKITKEKDVEETKHFEDARKFRFTAVGFALASALLFAIGSWFGVETMISSVSHN